MADETVKIRDEIKEKIRLIGVARKKLDARSHKKADTIREYRKNLGKVLIQLRNGITFDIDGAIVKNPPATLSLSIAHAICIEEKVAMDLAETQYKIAIEGMKALIAELNGLQSINRHLEDFG